MRPPIKMKIDPKTGSVIAIRSDGDSKFLQSLVVNPQVVEQSTKRVSHVLPVNPILRVVFRWLRDRFGEKGRIAGFTRRWPCLWQADMSPTGANDILGPYRNRQDAINAEIAWLDKHPDLLTKLAKR